MLTAVEGYYNGTNIVTNERVNLRTGQRVIITILDNQSTEESKERIDLSTYMGCSFPTKVFLSPVGVRGPEGLSMLLMQRERVEEH